MTARSLPQGAQAAGLKGGSKTTPQIAQKTTDVFAHKGAVTSADGRISLAQQLVQVTKCVQAVQAGRSLADALPAVPGALRPGVQALTFHALRHLGTTMALVGLLVERPPAAATRALARNGRASSSPSMPHASVTN